MEPFVEFAPLYEHVMVTDSENFWLGKVWERPAYETTEGTIYTIFCKKWTRIICVYATNLDNFEYSRWSLGWVMEGQIYRSLTKNLCHKLCHKIIMAANIALNDLMTMNQTQILTLRFLFFSTIPKREMCWVFYNRISARDGIKIPTVLQSKFLKTLKYSLIKGLRLDEVQAYSHSII